VLEAEAILERIDRIMRELEAIRAAVAQTAGYSETRGSGPGCRPGAGQSARHHRCCGSLQPAGGHHPPSASPCCRGSRIGHRIGSPHADLCRCGGGFAGGGGGVEVAQAEPVAHRCWRRKLGNRW
jgi:hypothetical protein